MTNYLKIGGYLLALGVASYVQIKIVSYVISEIEGEEEAEQISKPKPKVTGR